MYAHLGVTCHPHFWQNDKGLICATAVTRGWKRHQIKVSIQSQLWRRKFSCYDSNSQPFDHESSILNNKLSWLPFASNGRTSYLNRKPKISYAMHGWDQVQVWILQSEKSHSKCITTPFSLFSESYLNPEIRLYPKSPTHDDGFWCLPGQVERSSTHINTAVIASKGPGVLFQLVPDTAVETNSHLKQSELNLRWNFLTCSSQWKYWNCLWQLLLL